MTLSKFNYLHHEFELIKDFKQFFSCIKCGIIIYYGTISKKYYIYNPKTHSSKELLNITCEDNIIKNIIE